MIANWTRRWVFGIATVTVAAAGLRVFFDPPAGTVVNGLCTGALYGLMGAGLILIHRTHRIINFAVAALGAVSGIAGVLLMVTRGWSFYVCFPLALAGGAVVGAAVDVLILRRFARSPRLILTVATIGVAQILAYAGFLIALGLGTDGQQQPAPKTPFTSLGNFFIGGQRFNMDYGFALVMVLVAAATLGAFLRFTRLGIALRASAENADRAALLGVPVERVQTAAWMIAGTLGGLVIFLRATIVGVPGDGSLGYEVLLYALAAAVIARMDSIPQCLVAGMFIGALAEASLVRTGSSALATGLMFLLILVALLFQRRTVSRAAASGVSTWQAVYQLRPIPSELRSLVPVRCARIGLVLVAGAFLVAFPHIVSDSRIGYAQTIVIACIVSVSLVILSGWAGQISLGHLGLVGVGAVVAGRMAIDWNADIFIVLAAAAVAGAVVSALIGIPALRMPGLYLAVATLAFAAAMQHWFLNPGSSVGEAIVPTRGVTIETPCLWDGRACMGDSLGPSHGFYYFSLGVLVVAIALARAYHKNPAGRAILAMRDNENAAASYTIHPTVAKLGAFAVSGALAAVAGALIAYQSRAVDAANFGIAASIRAFVIVAIAGLTSITAAVFATVVLESIRLFGEDVVDNLSLIVTGPGLVVVLLVLPGGFAQAMQAVRDAGLRAVARHRGIEVPSLLGRTGPAAVEPHAEDAPAPTPAGTRDGGSRRRARSGDAHTAQPSEHLHLECRGVHVAYGSVKILFGVDLDVRRGEIVALLGTNGAGKSTLLRAVSGLMHVGAGTVRLDGQDITNVGPLKAARMGIIHVPGGKAVFPSLTVAEHFRMATWLSTSADEADIEGRVRHALTAFPRLQERWQQQAGNLSGGEQQQLGVAMAFVARPQLLIIDELSLGLAPAIVEQLLGMIREINSEGCAVVLVEQSVNVALTIAERAYFLEKGEVRFSGPTADLLERRDLLRSVFLEGAGKGDAEAPARAPLTRSNGARNGDRRVLAVRGLTRTFGGIRAVDDVSLELRDGEILGLIGPNGAGKTTVFDLLSGVLSPNCGHIELLGHDVTHLSAPRRAALGLGRSFQDARLFPSLTVAENLAVALHRHVEVRDQVSSLFDLPAMQRSEADIAYSVDKLVDVMNLGGYRDAFVSELSTGTRRVVDLAMAIAHQPTVLLLDEPSSGIAQRETEALGELLLRIQRETGTAMLVIEHDMALLRSVADEMIAFDLGRVVVRGEPELVLADERVVTSYLGGDPAVVQRSAPRGSASSRRAMTGAAR